MKIRDILARREVIRNEMRTLVDAHPTGDMPADAATRFATLETEAETLNAAESRQAALDALDRRAGGAPVTETPLAEAVATRGLTREMRMVDRVSRETGVAAAGISPGRVIHSLITGRRPDSQAEQRAMGEVTGTAGGYLLSAPVSSNIVDLVRNRSVLINAGAITLPMGGPTLRIPQVTGDPVADVRQEGAAIPETDGVFSALNLTAHSIGALVRVSAELLDDAPSFAAELDVQMAAVMALRLDYLGLYGTGAGNQPLGLRNTAGLQEVSMGANGVAFSGAVNYAPILALLQKLEEHNATPDTLVWAPRSKYELANIVDGVGVWLNDNRIPTSVAGLRKLTSNQVSTTETQGSANTASTIFVGGFDQVVVAIRNDVVIEVSREAAFNTNQVLVRALARFDVGVIRPALIGRLVGIL